MTNPIIPTDDGPSEPQDGRIVINKIFARLVNNYGKIITGAAVVAASYFGWNYFTRETGNKIIYDNKLSTFIETKEGREASAAYIERNGFNGDYMYGASDYAVSNPAILRDYVLRLRRHGVKDIAMVFSKPETITKVLDAYNKSCKNDSCKFSSAVMEYEQYQSGKSRPFFYDMLRKVALYCTANNILLIVYQGWPNQTDCDSLVYYKAVINLHAYGQFDKYSNVGIWCFSYMNSRLILFKNSVNKIFKDDLNYKVPLQLLTSCENPDQTKNQFGCKYFKTHTWEEPNSLFIGYWNLKAPQEMKNRFRLAGSCLFVKDQAKK